VAWICCYGWKVLEMQGKVYFLVVSLEIRPSGKGFMQPIDASAYKAHSCGCFVLGFGGVSGR
jgi:hypothetical protein